MHGLLFFITSLKCSLEAAFLVLKKFHQKEKFFKKMEIDVVWRVLIGRSEENK
jgi:hypothetical protein